MALLTTLISRGDERPAGLALITSLRKRLCSLPNKMACRVAWRVRVRNLASGAPTRLLSLALCGHAASYVAAGHPCMQQVGLRRVMTHGIAALLC